MAQLGRPISNVGSDLIAHGPWSSSGPYLRILAKVDDNLGNVKIVDQALWKDVGERLWDPGRRRVA